MMPSHGQPKPFIVPIFIPHAGCPHQCVFCNQNRTTGQSQGSPGPDQLHAAIAQFLGYRRDPRRPTEIAFYGGNFLGMPPQRIISLLKTAAGYVSQGTVQGLRFSTRPDTVSSETLRLLAGYPVSTIELGVQSMNDQVLEASRRGHTARDTHQAVALLRSEPYRLGLQMMVGLPGDSPDKALATGEEIAALAPDFVRIYPTLVIEGSPLARWYTAGRYNPLPLDETVDLVKSVLARFIFHDIAVIRMGLQPTIDLNAGTGIVAGPFHPAFGELVHAALWRDALGKWLAAHPVAGRSIDISVHPSILSRLRGCRNNNIQWLHRKFHLIRINTRTDTELPTDRVLINGQACHLLH